MANETISKETPEMKLTGREGLRTAFRQSLPLPNYR